MNKNLSENYKHTRLYTEKLCQGLESEDYVIQNAEFVSPTKWHLAHTSWFYEQLILIPHLKGYKAYNEQYLKLFNSYYNTFGEFWTQGKRGLLSRPTVKEIYQYRAHIDLCMNELLTMLREDPILDILDLIQLGLHHEKQHQELMVMDLKFNLFQNPLLPSIKEMEKNDYYSNGKNEFIKVEKQTSSFGADPNLTFCYDNETPEHAKTVEGFSIAKQLVTNEEYLEFIESGEIKNPNYWYSDGNKLRLQGEQGIPLYWKKINNQWFEYTLNGLEPLKANSPVKHISFYEASAYANYQDCKLPTEYQWELAANNDKIIQSPTDFHLNLWQWTSSPYLEYPGYQKPKGALGEYNQKFMLNQIVLKGGCQQTPQDHYRTTYRNFYYPHQKWMYSGIRLVKDSYERN